jgi:GT2 family glycosyltransferase
MTDKSPKHRAPERPPRPRKPLRAGRWQPAWLQSLVDDGPIDVSVCIANWNCRELLRSCLESLHDHPQGVRLETIVVDNGSGDGSAEMVARRFPEVILSRNADNRGFARANNQAARLARGHYLFFLNNDK